MQLILGDDRLDPWDLRHWMLLELRIGPLQGVLTVQARPRLDRDDHVHYLNWQQGPCLPLMARVAAAGGWEELREWRPNRWANASTVAFNCTTSARS